MTEDVDIVIAEPLVRSTLPEFLQAGATLVLHLVKCGAWANLAARLRVQREGGYVGIDALLFLVLFFGSGAETSIGGFAARAGLHGEALAALGGRRSLTTQSSMSRLLKCMTLDVVRDIGPWLLWKLIGAVEVLRHPVMQSRDANGLGWHIFDYDLTKTVLRQRGLPDGEDLPPPRRRADDFAAAGYPGHKRGEVQVSGSRLQHAGSRLWLGGPVNPGNGDGLASFRSSLRVIIEVCAELGHPLERALLRCDGEFGYLPALTECKEAGVAALTRLNRLNLLDQPDVRHRLAIGTWHLVPDSCAGPRRSALDLGMVQLPPGRDTRRPDGTPYAPIEVRAVVSRYPREGEAEHGRVIDGWQYELFAALEMPTDAWPAHEVVAAYFGRGGQENSFAQEDRELGLDRIFSYNLAGQELACLVGLMVWNLQTVHGFHLAPPPAERKAMPPAVPVVDHRPVPPGLVSVEAEDEPEAVEECAPVEPIETPDEALTDELRALDWAHLLRKRGDWTWEPEEGVLRCPAGTPTTLTTLALHPEGKASKLMFRAPAATCSNCPVRSTCLSSARSDASKLLAVSVPHEVGARLDAMLPAVQRARRLARSNQTLAAPPRSGRPRPRPTGAPIAVTLATNLARPHGQQVDHAPFLPAAARQAFRRTLEGVAIQVNVVRPTIEPPHPYIATSPTRRQRRRASWAERHAWYALPVGSSVRVTIHAGAALAATFPWVDGGPPATPTRKAGPRSSRSMKTVLVEPI